MFQVAAVFLVITSCVDAPEISVMLVMVLLVAPVTKPFMVMSTQTFLTVALVTTSSFRVAI
jgi:hypothetical protein